MKKLEFGTAGIRGILGKGEEFLNDIHVLNIINGFANYLLDKFPNAQKDGIVIGRDNRRESKNFAILAAHILSSYKIKVYFNEEITATPIISYQTRILKAVGAINVTASHNPKEYNGIKIYNSDGCQLLPWDIVELQKYFKDYSFYLDKTNVIKNEDYIEYISNDIIEKYLNEIIKIGGKDLNDLSNIKIAFTPQHGTGAKPVKEIFKKLNVNGFYEEREMKEDTEFTFSKSPNPEAKIAYDNVKEIAFKNDCDIILVTDPDSDRVGLAVKEGNDYKILTGNETAILIFNYLIENKKDEKYYLVYSFVSSSLPKKIAKENGINSYMTKTGFKWIGNLIETKEINGDKEKFLFGFEESYGSLINEKLCRDKDALQSIVILAKMCSKYKKNGLSFLEVLEDIYKKYGYVSSGAINVDLDNDKKQGLIKNKFKELKLENTIFLDYNEGIRGIEKEDMFSFEFEDGSWISLRPSGTEPKMKIYLFFINKNKDIAEQNFKTYYQKIQEIIK
ncbi:MAG: phospho-sugar mutase [Metamycoplasmataceae bacterium]